MKYSRQHRPLTGNLQGLSLRITQVSGPFPEKKRSDAISARGFTQIRQPHRRNLSCPSTLSLESHSKYHAIYANSGNS